MAGLPKSRSTIILLLVMGGFVIVGAAILLTFLSSDREGQSFVTRPTAPTALPKKIGIIRHFLVLDPLVDGFKSGMEEFGFINGKNVVYDIQLAAEGDPTKLSQIVKNYVQQEAHLIYAVDQESARAALDETEKIGKTYIPIVFAYASNPVETSLIQSFRSSGNNATGIAVNLNEVVEKKMAFLKQISPNIGKIGVFTSKFATVRDKLLLTQVRLLAPKFSLEVAEYQISSPPGLASTAELLQISQGVSPGEIGAYYHIPDPVVSRIENLKTIGEMGKRLGIPTIYDSEGDLRAAGGLFSFGHDLFTVGKQAAEIAALILDKGYHPKDIPVQSPKKNLLIINATTARESGITIPSQILEIADKIIK